MTPNNSNTRWTEAETQFIREHWQEMTDGQMAEALDRSALAVKQKRRKLGLNRNKMRWSDKEMEIVKTHYADTPNKQILTLLGDDKKLHHLHYKAYSMGLHKCKDYIENQLAENGQRLKKVGKDTRFNKGHESFNKGMKQEDYMSPEQIEKTKATRFKKGDKPWNTKYDGAVTIRRSHQERGEPPYLWIRLSEGQWMKYHRYVWEEENGPVLDKHIIVFKDSDTLNPELENLECISLAENARRNRNAEKTAETMRKIHAGEQKPKPLTNYGAALRLAGGDTAMKDYLMETRPDLVRAAKAHYKLQRRIKYGNE